MNYDDTAVYRLRDAAGDLLYVGVSGDPETRLDAHRQTKSWAAEITSVDTTWFASRADALAAEGAAIRSEGPRHNRSVPQARRPHHLNVDIAANVTRAREAAGISPASLARALGVRTVSVERWEAGTSRPSLPNHIALAELLFDGNYGAVLARAS